MRNKEPRNIVLLSAFDGSGQIVTTIKVSYDAYYETPIEMIDSDRYRARLGIRRIEGRIYDQAGSLQQQFANDYDSAGKYLHSKARHSDGSVIED